MKGARYTDRHPERRAVIIGLAATTSPGSRNGEFVWIREPCVIFLPTDPLADMLVFRPPQPPTPDSRL